MTPIQLFNSLTPKSEKCENSKMIDYISIELDSAMNDILFNNLLLDFVSEVSNKTGEVNPNRETIILTSEYQGMTFTIIQNKETKSVQRITLKGSIHKYWHNGTNYRDFDFRSLTMALNDLQEKFHIDWKETILHSFEFGVNVTIPISCKELIQSVVSYKGSIPNECEFHGRGQLLKFIKSQHILKIYNKGFQYYNSGQIQTDNDDLLRFEIHVDKMQYITAKDIHIHSVHDLLSKTNLERLGRVLMQSFDALVIIDAKVLKSPLKRKEREFIIDAKNPRYWKELNEKHIPKLYSRTFNRLQRILQKYQSNDHRGIVRELIQKKWSDLTKSVPFLPTLKKPNWSLFYPYIISNSGTLKDRRCIVSGIDITHQKDNSHFLSECSIKEIEKTDPILYSELERKFAPRNSNSDRNYLIAHNIRNKVSNRKRFEQRHYQNQLLFDIPLMFR
jgi:hypothetical protein